MKVRIELQNNVLLSGELSMMSEYTISIRVNNIDANTMQQLFSQRINVAKLSNSWSVCVCKDKIVGVNIWED